MMQRRLRPTRLHRRRCCRSRVTPGTGFGRLIGNLTAAGTPGRRRCWWRRTGDCHEMSLLRPSDRTSQRLEREYRPLLLQRLLRRVGRSGVGDDVRSAQSERLRDRAKTGRVSPQMRARLPRTHLAAILISATALFPVGARSEVASVYGGRDGHCGSRTANGERLNCAAMTAAHRTLPFGTRVRVCHAGCVIVRINDRGPWVRGRHLDLSPAAARAIGLDQTGQVTMTVGM